MSLNAEQAANARTIIDVGRRLGASDRDITVALATAMQESDLINVDHGDRDSLGLFQQRAAWAPAASRMNPADSAYMFFTGGQNGQRGLLDFKNRDQLSLTQAAQAVQVSAYPDAYAKWGAQASAALAAHGAGIQHATAATPATPPLGEVPSTDTPSPDSLTQGPGDPAKQATPDSLKTPVAGGQLPGAAVSPSSEPVDYMNQPMMGLQEWASMFPDAAQNQTFSDPSANGRRNDVVTAAMSYLGTPYVWGGNGRDGVDCSGLVQQVYKGFGIDVPRLSSDQIKGGRPTAYANLRPGDLIGWDENDRNNGADHIAVYAGNGEIIEAPRPGLAVRKRALSQHEIDTAMGASYGI